jgi:hypothetical protein
LSLLNGVSRSTCRVRRQTEDSSCKSLLHSSCASARPADVRVKRRGGPVWDAAGSNLGAGRSAQVRNQILKAMHLRRGAKDSCGLAPMETLFRRRARGQGPQPLLLTCPSYVQHSRAAKPATRSVCQDSPLLSRFLLFWIHRRRQMILQAGKHFVKLNRAASAPVRAWPKPNRALNHSILFHERLISLTDYSNFARPGFHRCRLPKAASCQATGRATGCYGWVLFFTSGDAPFVTGKTETAFSIGSAKQSKKRGRKIPGARQPWRVRSPERPLRPGQFIRLN